MPNTTSTVRSLTRELRADFTLRHGEDADTAMRRIDRAALDAVRGHLFGELSARQSCPATAGRLAGGTA